MSNQWIFNWKYMLYIVTAYCACKLCCGNEAKGITANGSFPRQNITCAAPRAIPFGTVLHIDGIGIRRVEDRLKINYDSRIDIYFLRHRDAAKFGKKKLNVTKHK
jgi:3D (Asp-Asp-Asp) domain-containing protein